MKSVPHVSRHAVERATERLGRELDAREWQAMILAIVERRASLLLIQADGREIWLVPCGSLALRVVWAPDTATIITVLSDGVALARASAAMKSRPVRKSFGSKTHYSGGKLRREKTFWRPEDAP
jgi:hypothetical protein